MAKIAATAFVDLPLEHRFRLHADLGLRALGKFKTWFRAIPQHCATDVIEFPPFAELEQKHPALFKMAGFVEGRNDPVLSAAQSHCALVLGMAMPLRETKIMSDDTILPGFRLCKPRGAQSERFQQVQPLPQCTPPVRAILDRFQPLHQDAGSQSVQQSDGLLIRSLSDINEKGDEISR